MRRVKGFTLVELMVVMAILGVLAALTTPNIIDELNHRRSNLAASETQAIVDAARSYRVKNGTWPGDSTCSNALSVLQQNYLPYIPSSGAANKFNSLYSTSCTSTTFSLDQEAVQDWDGFLVNAVASTQIVDASNHRIRTTIGIPGTEPALDSKLSRLASGNAELNRMRTTLLLGGNNITEVGTIDAGAATFSGNVNAASGTFAGNVSANSAGVNSLTSNYAQIGSLGVSQASVAGNLNTSTLTVQQAAAIAGALSVQGASQFSGVAVYNDVVVINKVVSEGAGGCGRGYIATDASGKLLTCQSGIWTSNGGGAPQFLSLNIKGNSRELDVTNYPCPAGYIKTGWDTTGQGWRQSSVSPGLYIGANDWAMVFCAKY